MPAVLVIDDDPQIAMSIATAEPAWKVIHALDGLEGLDTLRHCLANQTPIDLIVLDIDMPDLDGYDTLVQIRHLNQTIPIIIFTGMVDDRELDRFVDEVGHVPILYKGVSPETLSHRLRAVLGMAPEPVQRTAMFTRLQRKVAEQEQHARQKRAVRVALVSPARSNREGMRVLLEAAGAHVAVAAPEMPLVRHALAQFRVSILIAAASEWRAALDLALEAAVPLLLVAATVDEALTVVNLTRFEPQHVLPVSIIIDDDLDPHELRGVLDVIVGGGHYVDSALSVSDNALPQANLLEVLRVTLRDTELSARDLEFLALEMQDLPPEQIAQRLAIKVESVYTARSRICHKLEVGSIFELRQWVRARIDQSRRERPVS